MQHEVELVEEFLARPEDHRGVPRSRWVPVLVFTGPRSSSKTRLLGELEAALDIPHARQDLEVAPEMSTWQRLSALVFELSRERGRFGRLGFPRFITGQLVIAQQLNRHDRDRARAQVVQALEAHRNVDQLRLTLGQILADVAAAGLLGPVPVPGAVGQLLPNFVISGLTAWRWGRRVVLGTGQHWYGHQDRQLDRDPIDELVDLNQMTHRPNDDRERLDAEELLWSAFLADLRAEFRRSRYADRRTLNCAVLLDNIDSPAGRGFLDGLVRARDSMREEEPLTGGDLADPLTVVATSRSSTQTWANIPSLPTAEDASYEDYTQWHGGVGVERNWYPVQLRNFTRNEVVRLVADAGMRDHRGIAAAVHRFTDGHPGSTDLLLTAFADAERRLELHALLESTSPPDHRSVEDRLLDLFLANLSAAARADLVTCAAAPDLEQARRLGAASGLLVATAERDEVFAPSLWFQNAPGGPAVLPRVLRRLLVRQLAGRPAEHPASWAKVHGFFRETGAGAKALHHALAIGEVEAVTRQLAELLRGPELSVADWRAVLETTVSAPNRVDPAIPPLRHVQELSAWARGLDEPLASLAKLVPARWLENDPLLEDGLRLLKLTIADAYDRIAPHSDDMAALLEDGQKYRRDAEQIR
ncbi:hypothetical protein F1721_03655 [Saccharopolyspora hirsuta]|uniref:Uncharacterized protein n=1 Tax=Saccharopolyspora hirsuta TaxID=1837 RepID=A0A5M7CB39_SACHI|nr:hypothetical protein [Saccharopolyspora hirsuta]KAA5836941.1 hypothetical protein F1721_03655 [Saccharopolyspora hirsuta]